MLWVVVASILASGPADPRSMTGNADSLLECRAITDDTQRLACFDRIAGRVAADDLVVIDRKRLARERRQRFGLPAEGDGALAAATNGKVPAVQAFSSTVRNAERARDYGRWDIELADGTVWQSVDTSSFPPASGATITIRRATLGGFRASIPGRTSFLVKRLR